MASSLARGFRRAMLGTVPRRLIWAMAGGAGAAVANLYYAQPLLPAIAAAWGLSARAVASVVTLTQLGYGFGILAVVPLGDALERRRLIVTMLALSAAALLATAGAPGPLWLAAASFAIGFTSITPQLLVPFAAHLADPGSRGRAVGTVMSGLLAGVLLARTASGALGAWFGWRAMYAIAAGLMLVLAALLRAVLPRVDPAVRGLQYGKLLASLAHLVRDEPVLISSGFLGAMSFASFSAFWTVLPFFAAGPPYHYGSGVVGLFGVVGLAGVAVAPLAGRLADRGRTRVTVAAAFVSMLAAYALLWWKGTRLAWLIAGILLLDAGGTANHIVNQSRVYSVRPEARNRMNTVYMVVYFAGGAAGSLAGAWGWSRGGWPGFCLAASAFLCAGLLVHALAAARGR